MKSAFIALSLALIVPTTGYTMEGAHAKSYEEGPAPAELTLNRLLSGLITQSLTADSPLGHFNNQIEGLIGQLQQIQKACQSSGSQELAGLDSTLTERIRTLLANQRHQETLELSPLLGRVSSLAEELEISPDPKQRADTLALHLRVENSELQELVKQLETKIAAQERRIDELQHQLREAQVKITSLEEHAGNIALLQTQLRELKEANTRLRTALTLTKLQFKAPAQGVVCQEGAPSTPLPHLQPDETPSFVTPERQPLRPGEIPEFVTPERQSPRQEGGELSHLLSPKLTGTQDK